MIFTDAEYQPKPVLKKYLFSADGKLKVSARNKSMHWTGNYYFVKHNGRIFLPVDFGDHLCFVVENLTNDWLFLPMYIEGVCLFHGGHSEPEKCSTDYGWEIPPRGKLEIDAMKDPRSPNGRPLIIGGAGEGLGIGENIFGTTSHNGEVCIYARKQKSFKKPVYKPIYGDVLYRDRVGTSDVLGKDCGSLGITTDVAIGLGAEEYRPHTYTGITYEAEAIAVPTIFLQSRKKLRPLIDAALNNPRYWYWTLEEEDYFCRPQPSIAPSVPVIKPHRRRS